MIVRQVTPEERLPNLASSDRPGDVYKNRMVNLPRYLCPQCGQYTVFDLNNGDGSPFPLGIKRIFDSMTQDSASFEQGIADFFCRGCNRPVRVVFRSHEFHMAAYHNYAEAVFELVD